MHFEYSAGVLKPSLAEWWDEACVGVGQDALGLMQLKAILVNPYIDLRQAASAQRACQALVF